MIRKCNHTDIPTIFSVINDAARAYKGVIPEDRWHEPYMSMADLESELNAGVAFWCKELTGRIAGVMGIQEKGDVVLIRHAYVRTRNRNQGIGTQLLCHLESLTRKPILIGTWAEAKWAVSFYEKNGYRVVALEEKNRLLRKYWTIPQRQIETSVVLASQNWDKTQHPGPGRST
jgi:GNAT superfamily N-acetyltransferase